MKLHEHDKYNGSLRARKSFHFFGNVIVCLGSDIENSNTDYNTETTIFQLAMTNDSIRNYWNNYKNAGSVWTDHIGTGYYIPAGRNNNLRFEKNYNQISRMQNTGKETSGDWVSLVFDHRKAPPQKASYEYAVIPRMNKTQISDFEKKPPYKILQHNSEAHIVKDIKTNTTSYVLFERPNKLPEGILQDVDSSCLIMIKENKRTLILTVAIPI